MGHSRDTVQTLLQLTRQCLGDSGTAWPPGKVWPLGLGSGSACLKCTAQAPVCLYLCSQVYNSSPCSDWLC